MLGSSTGRAMLAAGLLLFAHGGMTSASADNGLGGVLVRGGGSSFAAPLFKGWIEAINPLKPEKKIQYDSVGSG